MFIILVFIFSDINLRLYINILGIYMIKDNVYKYYIIICGLFLNTIKKKRAKTKF